MPVQPDRNYLADVNAAIRQRSTARRRRIDATLNPLEEAGRMDRLQNASVSGDLGAVQDSGYGGPTLATVGGGRSMPISMRGPLRQMFGMGGDDEGCPGGQCGVPTTTTVGGTMGGSTVMGSTGEIIMGEPVPPAMPAIEPQRPGEDDGAFFARQARAYADHYIGLPAPFSRPSVLGANEALSLRDYSKFRYDDAYRNKIAAETIRLNTADIERDREESLRQDKAVDSEVALNKQMEQQTREGTGLGVTGTHDEILDAVTSYKIGAESAVAGLVYLRTRSQQAVGDKQGASGKQGAQDEPQKSVAEIEKESRRAVYGRLFMQTFLDLSESLRASTLPGDEGQLDLTNDQAAKRALEQIASGYTTAGLFDNPSFGGIDEALANDAVPVLRTQIPEMFAKAAQDYVAESGLKGDEAAARIDKARRRGLAAAVAAEDYMREKLKEWHLLYLRKEWSPSDPFAEPKPQGKPRPGDYPGLRRFMEQKAPRNQAPANTDSSMITRPVDSNDTLPMPPTQRRQAQVARSV